MRLPLLFITLLLSASSVVAEHILEWNPVPLQNRNQRLAQSYSSDVVFILLYNPGTNQQGIHTLEHDKAAPEILLFESEKDALVYSARLESQDFPTPTVVAISKTKIEEFIIDNNYRRLFVESGRGVDAPIGEGSLLPPDHNY